MRVLLVHPHMMVYGGAETVVTKLAIYLTKRGIENAILTLSISSDLLNVCKGLHLITPSKKYVNKIRTASFFNAIGLVNEITALRIYTRKYIDFFDVINVHNCPATWSIFPHQKPCVWMCNEPPDLWHNLKPSPPLRILRNIGVACDRLIISKSISAICVGDEISAKRVIERYGRQPKIIHYGIDYDFFSSGDKEQVLQRFDLHDAFVLLQVGWISPQKNQLESIKAVEQLRKDIPNIKLVLAGSGGNSYEKMLKEYVHMKGLEKYVIFTGHLPKLVIRDLYHACDLSVFPIRTQGGWLAPFEALCASKPIIVSPSMTAATIIEREKIGVVTNDFAKAVWDVYNDSSPYYDMARRGKRWVADNLSWDMFCQRMVEVFESVL